MPHERRGRELRGKRRSTPVKFADDAHLRVDGLLRDLAGLLRDGEPSVIANLRPIRIGIAASPLDQACSYWLPDNRLDWWETWNHIAGIDETKTGSIESGVQQRADPWLCEFSPALATISGMLSFPPKALAANNVTYPTLSWEMLPDGSSPNQVPGLPMTFLVKRYWSIPVLQSVQVQSQEYQHPFTAKVAVSAIEPHTDPNDIVASGQLMTPLTIFFHAPQRAVGLEYGFLPLVDGQQVMSNQVTLIARDRDGAIIAQTTADPTAMDPFFKPIPQNRIDNLIGLRDRQARISSVELQFGTDQNGKPLAVSAIIARVWSEPFPVSAALQDTLDYGWQLGEDLGGKDATYQADPVSLPLPFHCDKAVALLRGFGADALQTSFDIDGVTIGFQFRVSGGVATLTPSGDALDRIGNAFAQRTRIYYTVLAWDSSQADILFSSASSTTFTSDVSDETGVNTGSLRITDPCVAATGRSTDQTCGAVTAFPTGCDITLVDDQGNAADQELNTMMLAFVTPSRSGGQLSLPFAWNVVGGGYPGKMSFAAVALTGTSLVAGPEVGPLSGAPLEVISGELPSARPPGQYNIADPGDVRAQGYAPAIRAEMAFLGLGLAIVKPDGPVRSIDVEVHGANFDGATLDWEAGGGASTQPALSGGITIGPQDRHFVMVFPRSAGINPRATTAQPNLWTQDGIFDGVVGVWLSSGRRGILANLGDAPATIVDVHEGGPDAGDFLFRYYVTRRAIDLGSQRSSGPPALTGGQSESPGFIDQLWNELPLVLWPGDAVLIGGYFVAPSEGRFAAAISFTTNDRASQYAVVNVTGVTMPNRAQGEMVPVHRDFGQVPVRTSLSLNFMITSDGPTPLVIDLISIDDATQGFSIGGQYDPNVPLQIASGSSYTFQVNFSAGQPGRFQTTMTARTNAGTFQSQLLAQAT